VEADDSHHAMAKLAHLFASHSADGVAECSEVDGSNLDIVVGLKVDGTLLHDFDMLIDEITSA